MDAVETVAAVLDALVREGGSARLRDLATRSGLAPPKVHRYLVSMVETGLVEREDGRDGYRLGLLARRVGRAADRGGDVLSGFLPAVRDFAERHGQTCGLARFADGVVTVPHWVVPSREFAITPRPGRNNTYDLTASSTGKLFGAFLPAETTRPLIEAELASGEGASRRPAVERAFAEIRLMGFASGVGPLIKGINALSVPVFDEKGALAFGVTAIGHESVIEIGPDSPFATDLKALGRWLTRQLGGTTP